MDNVHAILVSFMHSTQCALVLQCCMKQCSGFLSCRYYRGRGAFESLGAGLPMAPGDIAFKSNFATLNPATGVVEKRRADRQFEHLGPTLCAALDGERT